MIRKHAHASSEMAQIVELIGRYGPDISEISRRSGQFKETVRYRYKEKVVKKGMVVQASIDEGALGLTRIVTKVTLSDRYVPYAQQLFWAMHELCYLSAFEMALPEDYYVLHFSIPKHFTEQFKGLLSDLEEMGILASVETYQFDWFRRIPMRADSYDFDAGRWDYDWNAPVAHVEDKTIRGRSDVLPFDLTDLLLLKELHLDAGRSLAEIKDSLKSRNGIDVNYKTLAWHYKSHIVPHGFISGYVVRWLGTRYDQEADKAEQRMHRYIVLTLLVKGTTERETMALMAKMAQTPFLWAEAGGRDYFAQCAFPIEMTTEAMEYLRQVIRPVRARAVYHMVDQKNALSFTVNHQLWNEAEKKWRFEKDDLLARFRNLVLRTRPGPGPSS